MNTACRSAERLTDMVNSDVVGSGPIAGAPDANLWPAGVGFYDPATGLYLDRKLELHSTVSTDYLATKTAFNEYWATAWRINAAESTSKIRLRFKNNSQSEKTFTAYVANTVVENGVRSSVSDDLTEDLSTGWKTLSITIPANSYGFSEWIDNTFLTPADGGNPIFLVKVPSVLDLGFAFYPANRRNPIDGWRSYNSINSLAAVGTENVNVLTGLGYELDYYSAQKRLIVIAVGDSITYGFGGATGSWFCRDGNLSIYKKNIAYPGRTTSQYLASLQTQLAASPASIVFYSPFSPNDGVSQTAVGVQKSNFDSALSICKSNGALLVPTNLTPNDNYTIENYAARSEVIDYALGKCKYVADIYSSVAQGVNPDRYIVGLNADAVHPNSSGYNAMAAEFDSVESVLYNPSNRFWIPIESI